MFKFRKRKLTGVLVALVAVVAAVGAYAFTASNTVPTHDAGVGFNTVSGYAVTDHPVYQYTADAQEIDKVTFTLDKDATAVAIAVVAQGATPVAADWRQCNAAATGGTPFACTWTGANYPSDASDTATEQDVYVAAEDQGADVAIG
jgi:hypothetical protein